MSNIIYIIDKLKIYFLAPKISKNFKNGLIAIFYFAIFLFAQLHYTTQKGKCQYQILKKQNLFFIFFCLLFFAVKDSFATAKVSRQKKRPNQLPIAKSIIAKSITKKEK